MVKLLGGVIGALAIALLTSPSSVYAADLAIPLDFAITGGASPGERVELTVVAAGPLTGRTCELQATRPGQGGAHPGSDLIVTSGDQVSTLADVERSPDATTGSAEPITLGDTITVELVVGADGVYEGDVVLELTCQPGPAAPNGALPVTGAASTFALALGAALVIAGGALHVVSRAGAPRPGLRDER